MLVSIDDFVVGLEVPCDYRKYITERLVPQMPATIREAVREATNEGSIEVRNSYYSPAEELKNFEGVLCLGDALSMRHALSGSGMTSALLYVSYLTKCTWCIRT